MPICKRADWAPSNSSIETFRDEEEVFFCDVTRQIFRDHEEYFRHTITINCTVWQCEETNKEGLTFVEALKSEKAARKKIENFKNSLRPIAMMIIDQAKQSSIKQLSHIVVKFLRRRYFRQEEVMAQYKASSWHSYIVEDILADGSVPVNQVYEETEKLKYKLRRTGAGNNNKTAEVITVPFEAIRRTRNELSNDITSMFVKKHVVRVDGILYAKPESYKLYVSDKNVTFGSLFIGKMPYFTPARPSKLAAKKQASMNKYLEKETANAEKQAAKQKSLQEQMERLKLERMEKLEQLEKEKQEKKEKLMQRIDKDCYELLVKTDDLERKDQKLLPRYKSIQTLIPLCYFGDVLMLSEFLHYFGSNLLSGINVFRGGITLHELSRAFTVREVAGPLADILLVLLNTIFDLQREEEEDTGAFTYNVGSLKQQDGSETLDAMALGGRTHLFVKRHYSIPLNQLPVDALTLSEVLRLHLLASGAMPPDNVVRWRVMYRSGYYSQEDPGLELRLQRPHILQALRTHTVFQLPFADIMRILRCLMMQILSYANTLTLIDERMENTVKARAELRLLMTNENRRQSQLQQEKKNLLNEFKQRCSEEDIRTDADKKAQLELKLNKKVAELEAQSERDQRKHAQQLEKLQQSVFTHFTELGMDRAYRKYYVLHSVPGIFVEHSKDCLDQCLAEPPQQNTDDTLRNNTANVPKSRAALTKHLLKLYADEEKKQEQEAKQARQDAKKSTENKENQSTQVLETAEGSTTMLNGHAAEALPNVANDKSSTDMPTHKPTAYELYMCTGDKHNCIVHDANNKDRQRWAFISDRNSIEALIDNLNPLGEREMQLREQLLTMRDIIFSHVRNCPHNYLHMDAKQMQKFKHQMVYSTNFKYSKSNFGYNFKEELNEVMHFALADRLLQFEEEIYTGDLGRLKVHDMRKWREDLVNNAYDPQVKLQWGNPNANQKLSNGDANPDDGTSDEDVVLDAAHVDEDCLRGTKEWQRANRPFCDPGENLHNKLAVANEDSADEEEEMPVEDSSSLRQVVKKMASALLQIEQGIERRFMKEPFGVSRTRIKDKDLLKRSTMLAKLRLQQWETSLMESTSYAQIFLHLNILNDCIIWGRSTNKSMCIICRRGTYPDKMLLCDECNSGTHMFCMKPAMKTVPKGNWYCRRCVDNLGLQNETTKQKEAKKQRRTFVMDDEDNNSEAASSNGGRRASNRRSNRLRSVEIEELLQADDDSEEQEEEEEEEENEEEGEEEQEQEEEEQETDDEDDKPLAKLNGVAAAYEENDDEEAEDNEDVDEENEEQDEEAVLDENNEMNDGSTNSDNETDEQEDGDENTCIVCAYDGADIMCGRCKDIYHTECANLKRKPRNNFICSNCKDKEDKKRKYKDNYSEDDDDFDNQPKRARSSRTALRNGPNNTESATSKSSRLSGRRTGENLPLDTALIYKLLEEIMKNENAWPFLRPVSLAEVPDYLEIVKNPIDLAKIKSKLNMCAYKNNDEVMKDMRLVFQNCDDYNTTDNDIYIAGCELEKFVMRRCAEYNLKFLPSSMNAE